MFVVSHKRLIRKPMTANWTNLPAFAAFKEANCYFKKQKTKKQHFVLVSYYITLLIWPTA